MLAYNTVIQGMRSVRIAFASPAASLSRLHVAAPSIPLEVAIVGSGPAGLYTADRVSGARHCTHFAACLDTLPSRGSCCTGWATACASRSWCAAVLPRRAVRAVYHETPAAQERLAMPFGLVRFGVAPDHPDTKNVQTKFGALLRESRVSLVANASLGVDVSLLELRRLFHAVVVATGAGDDRRLGIPGEELPGVLGARQFVAWYNGHPEAADLQPGLQGAHTVVVVGNGNVAVDGARLLLKDPALLASTDIAAHALEAFRASAVRRVVLVGRRGPAQAAFTPKELRELLALPGVALSVAPEELALEAEDEADLAAARIRRRAVEELRKAAAAQSRHGAADRELVLRFRRAPTAFVEGRAGGQPTGRVGAVNLEEQLLSGPSGARAARGTGLVDQARMLCLSACITGWGAR